MLSLCKFLTKVLLHSDVPCYKWLANQYLQGDISHSNRATWKALTPMLKIVQNSTVCHLGSGKHISFWMDYGRLRADSVNYT